jgi:hypothetical protein
MSVGAMNDVYERLKPRGEESTCLLFRDDFITAE